MILFLAGEAIDGVLEWSGGRRVRLEGGQALRSTESAQTWLLPGGGVVDGFEAIVLHSWQRQFSLAREQAKEQIGSAPVAVRLVVPPDLSEVARDGLVIACHLAGFANADCLGLEQCLEGGSDSAQSRPVSIVQWGASGLRAWALETGSDRSAECRYTDLGDEFSAATLSAELVERAGLRDRTASDAALVFPDLLSADPSDIPAQACVADPGGTPEVIFVGRSLRQEFGARARDLLTKALGDDWGELHLFGPFSGLLMLELDSSGHASRVKTDRSLSAPLETAPIPAGKAVLLTGCLSVGSEFLQRAAGAAIEVAAGSRLPLVRIFESFRTGGMIDQFAIHFEPVGGKAVTIATVTLPPLLEGKPFSRLRLRILADSDRFLVIAVNLAAGLVEHTIVHDKRAGCSAIS